MFSDKIEANIASITKGNTNDDRNNVEIIGRLSDNLKDVMQEIKTIKKHFNEEKLSKIDFMDKKINKCLEK